MAFKVGGYVDMLGQVAANGGKRALDKGDFVTKGTVLARVHADYVRGIRARFEVGEVGCRARLFGQRAVPAVLEPLAAE